MIMGLKMWIKHVRLVCVCTLLGAATASHTLEPNSVSATRSAIGGTYGHTGQGHHSKTLRLKLKGHVRPHCGIGLENQQIFENLTDGPGHRVIAFEVDCNEELQIEMRSLNGGLQHENASLIGVQPGFLTLLPYDLSVNVQASNAQTVNVGSQEIKNIFRGGSIGVIPYRTSGQLELRWSPENPLIGGRYRDVIEIRTSGKGR